MADEAVVTAPSVAAKVDPTHTPEFQAKVSKVNAENEKLHNEQTGQSPDPELHELYERYRASEKDTEAGVQRDEKGRFLPKDGEAKKEEPTDAEAKDGSEDVVADRVDSKNGDEDSDEATATSEKGYDAKAESAADETLDVATVAKAARLGLEDDEIDQYTNAELKAVVKALEKRKGFDNQDKKVTTSEQVEAKEDKAPAVPEPDYDKLIEEGHDEGLVNALRTMAANQKSQDERSKSLAAQLKALTDQRQAEDSSREAEVVDKWFDEKGEQYGKGRIDSLRKGNAEAAKAREAVYRVAAAIAEVQRAEGKELPLAELLEMGHAALNRKSVEQVGARKVSRAIQESKNKRMVAPPSAAPIDSMPKRKLSASDMFYSAFKETLDESGSRF